MIRHVYLNGVSWCVVRISPHPRSRIIVWTFHGVPRLGQTYRCQAVYR